MFLSVAVSQLQSVSPERAAALVLRQFEGDSFDALERRVRRNHSLRDALDYTEPRDVPDGTSLWRTFDDLDPDDLRNCLQSMCTELLEDHDHGGEFVVIDGTHIAAWANTRDEIEDGDVDVDGASWGYHEGEFYGYKVFLVVDAATELPVAITMETGSRNDSAAFEPHIEDFDKRYDTDDLHFQMLCFFLEKYDPDVRALWRILLGSTFILTLFLTDLDLSNPYFVVGILITSFAVGFSATILIRKQGSNWVEDQ